MTLPVPAAIASAPPPARPPVQPPRYSPSPAIEQTDAAAARRIRLLSAQRCAFVRGRR